MNKDYEKNFDSFFDSKNNISSIEFNNQNPLYFSLISGLNLFFFSEKNFKIRSKIFSKKNVFNSGNFKPGNSGLFAICGRDKKIDIIDYKKNKILKSFNAHKDIINDLCFSENRSNLISGSSDKTIKVWDISTQKCIISIKCHRKMVSSVSYVPYHDSLIASASYDGRLRIFDLRLPKTLILSLNHKSPIEVFKFSKCGKNLATLGGQDLKIWSPKNYNEFITFSERKLLSSFDYCGNNTLLYGTFDGEVREINLYDKKVSSYFTHKIPVTLLSTKNQVIIIAFSDGRICKKKFIIKKEKDSKESIYKEKIKNNHTEFSSSFFFVPKIKKKFLKKKKTLFSRTSEKFWFQKSFRKKRFNLFNLYHSSFSFKLFLTEIFRIKKSYFLLIFFNIFKKEKHLFSIRKTSVVRHILELIIQDIGIFSFKESFFILEKIFARQIFSINKNISFLTMKNLIKIKKKKRITEHVETILDDFRQSSHLF
jgi:WD40 repeat protein